MAGSYGVIVTREASTDLDGIYAYIARESPQNASEVAERLIDAMVSLKFLPIATRSIGEVRVPAVRYTRCRFNRL